MKAEFYIANDIGSNDKHMVIYGIGIISGGILDPENSTELMIPIIRDYGSYEELRASVHRDIDRMFDSVTNTGEFAK